MSATRLPPLAASSLLHLAIVATAVAAMLATSSGLFTKTPQTQNVPLDVIDFPNAPPQPIAQAPRAKPQAPSSKRQVFGLSKKAIIDESAGAPEVKAGNTLAKTPDNEKLNPGDDEDLPIPTEEYLVSQMPVLERDYRVPYPPEARRKGIQGAVIFDLLIDAEGKVRQATLVEGPDPALIEAARAAVMKLGFKPAQVDGKPVAVRIRYRYQFQIER